MKTLQGSEGEKVSWSEPGFFSPSQTEIERPSAGSGSCQPKNEFKRKDNVEDRCSASLPSLPPFFSPPIPEKFGNLVELSSREEERNVQDTAPSFPLPLSQRAHAAVSRQREGVMSMATSPSIFPLLEQNFPRRGEREMKVVRLFFSFFSLQQQGDLARDRRQTGRKADFEKWSFLFLPFSVWSGSRAEKREVATAYLLSLFLFFFSTRQAQKKRRSVKRGIAPLFFSLLFLPDILAGGSGSGRSGPPLIGIRFSKP